MKSRLEGKVCAITGAGRGIGYASASLFAAEGALVYILEVDVDDGLKAEAAIREEGGSAVFVECDVSDYGSVENALGLVAEKSGLLNVLYNNASVFLGGQDGKIGSMEQGTWKRVMGINLTGIFNCCKFSLPLIRKAGGGAVINTASSAGIIGIPGCDAYTASKGAAVSLTRSMAVEYGPENIRVNCIAPAAIATDMAKESNPEGDGFDAHSFINLRAPLRRWGRPGEVARLALFLASDDSSYINGAVIPADGGITINGDLSKPCS